MQTKKTLFITAILLFTLISLSSSYAGFNKFNAKERSTQNADVALERIAIADTVNKRVYIYEMYGDLLNSLDLSSIGMPTFVRATGTGDWLVKVYLDNWYDWALCYIDRDGNLIETFYQDEISPGPYFCGLENGNYITGKYNNGMISLFDQHSNLITNHSVWNEIDGNSYNYTMLGDVAGLAGGGFAALPELGTSSLCFAGSAEGQGITPYIYIYNNDMQLQRAVDIIDEQILVFTLTGLANGGFAGLGNTDGSEYPTHLFLFDVQGNIKERTNISIDIPDLAENCYMFFSLSSTSEGSILVSKLFSSQLWVLHQNTSDNETVSGGVLESMNFTQDGLSSISSVSGYYFQIADNNTDTDNASNEYGDYTIPDTQDNDQVISCTGCHSDGNNSDPQTPNPDPVNMDNGTIDESINNSIILSLSTDYIDFSEDDHYAELMIKNAGNGPMKWEIINMPEWIVASPLKGDVDSETDVVKIVCVRENLDPGIYAGVLEVRGKKIKRNNSRKMLPPLTTTTIPPISNPGSGGSSNGWVNSADGSVQLTLSMIVPEPENELEAEFYGCIASDDYPINVQFQDKSFGEIVSWTWDFGDGGYSYMQNPQHEYQKHGTYTISLTVLDAGGKLHTVTKVDCVKVGGCPLDAEFTSSRTSGAVQLPVTFKNTSTGAVSDYLWDFGDGVQSDDPGPEHTYLKPGVYDVSLTVSGAGCTDTEIKQQYIVVDRYCTVMYSLNGRANSAATIKMLRTYRDLKLKTDSSGKVFAGLYYYFSDEIVTMLQSNPSLNDRLAEVIEEIAPVVHNVLLGEQAYLDSQVYEKAKNVLSAIADNGGILLKVAIRLSLNKIENDLIDQKYGIELY